MKLVFKSSPDVIIATNTFSKVPVILKYEDTPLIEIPDERGLGFMPQIKIYHPDGSFLGMVKGNHLFRTETGEKANLRTKDHPRAFLCFLDNKTLFQLIPNHDDSFKIQTEIFTPDGSLVKCTNAPQPELIDCKGKKIPVSGIAFRDTFFEKMAIGMWIRRTGRCSIGVRHE